MTRCFCFLCSEKALPALVKCAVAWRGDTKQTSPPFLYDVSYGTSDARHTAKSAAVAQATPRV